VESAGDVLFGVFNAFFLAKASAFISLAYPPYVHQTSESLVSPGVGGAAELGVL
jgi:hypothetical protein